MFVIDSVKNLNFIFCHCNQILPLCFIILIPSYPFDCILPTCCFVLTKVDLTKGSFSEIFYFIKVFEAQFLSKQMS